MPNCSAAICVSCANKEDTIWAHCMSLLRPALNACMQDLSAPCRSAVEVHWRQPRKASTTKETSIVVKVTHLKLQPAFAHVPLVHAAIHSMQSGLESQKQVRQPA